MLVLAGVTFADELADKGEDTNGRPELKLRFETGADWVPKDLGWLLRDVLFALPNERDEPDKPVLPPCVVPLFAGGTELNDR